MKIVNLFQHDPNGLAIPFLEPESKWVVEKQGWLLTIKLDGLQVRVEKDRVYRHWPVGSSAEVECLPAYGADKPIIEAFVNASKIGKLADGLYCAFGPGIKGNEMAAEEPYMVCICPMRCGQLVVNRQLTKIKAGYDVSAQDLFDSIKAELEESPEIEGFVFLYEETIEKPKWWAMIKRQELGLQWPQPLIAGG